MSNNIKSSDRIYLPVGRFVAGSLTQKRTVDFENRPIPEDKQRFEFGIAVEKANPDLPSVFQQIATYAWQYLGSYPQIAAAIQSYNLESKGVFSWKISDGDKPNAQGQINENTKGCYVFWFSVGWPVRCVDFNSANAEIPPESVERGYYVDMSFEVSWNGLTNSQAGIYLNPVLVRLVGYGEKITGGVSAEEAFGDRQPTYRPAGMSSTPVAGQMPGMGGAQQQQQQQQQQMPGMGGTPQQQMPGMGGAQQQQMPGMGGTPQQQMPGMGGAQQQQMPGMGGTPQQQMPQQMPGMGGASQAMSDPGFANGPGMPPRMPGT